MALFELVLEQSYFGQQCINRWNYTAPAASPGVDSALALATAFGAITTEADIFPAGGIPDLIRSVQNSAVHFESVFVRNLYVPTDFFEGAYAPPITGAIVEQGLPPFAAFGFRTNRTRLDIRRGMKRFVGVPETANENGGAIPNATLTALVSIATEMNKALTFSGSDVTQTFTPCILHKQKLVDAEGNITYKLYSDVAVQEANMSTGFEWQPYLTVRTQNSRQYGRGS